MLGVSGAWRFQLTCNNNAGVTGDVCMGETFLNT